MTNRSVFAPPIPEFSRLHPGLTVDMGLNDRVVDLVEEGWDVAVRIGRVQDQTLIARKLARCRLLIAGSAAYLADHGTPRTVADLSSHNCLGYTLSSALGPHQWSFGVDGAVVVPVSGNLQAGNGDVLVAAAVAGQGLVYQPTFLLGDDIRARRLQALNLDHPTMELAGVYAVYAANRRPLAKVRAFIDFLVQQFSPSAPWDAI